MIGLHLGAYVALGVTVAYSGLRFGWFLPRVHGIPILMYHNVGVHGDRGLVVQRDDFERQLAWLQARGYRSLSMDEYLQHAEGRLDCRRLDGKPVLITFDDGYRGIVDHALPLLKRYGFSGTLFLCTSMVDLREQGACDEAISIDEVRRWVTGGMHVALHSHSHEHFTALSDDDIVRDLRTNMDRLAAWTIPFTLALAYPHGARPKPQLERHRLESVLARNGIRATFRIGNRVQPFVARPKRGIENYRVGVCGGESLLAFKNKVLKGRPIRV